MNSDNVIFWIRISTFLVFIKLCRSNPIELATEISDMHKIQKLCSSTLADVMHEHCEAVNEVPLTGNNYVPKKGIASECCQKPCSKYYILTKYCNKTKFDISKYSTTESTSLSFPSSLERENQSIGIDETGQVRHRRPSSKIIKKTQQKQRAYWGKRKCGCRRHRHHNNNNHNNKYRAKTTSPPGNAIIKRRNEETTTIRMKRRGQVAPPQTTRRSFSRYDYSSYIIPRGFR